MSRDDTVTAVPDQAPTHSRWGALGLPTTAAITAVVIVFAVLPGAAAEQDPESFVVATTALFVAIAAIGFRVRVPRTAFAVCVAAGTVGIGSGGPIFAFLPPVLLALFTVAARTTRVATIVSVCIAAAMVALTATGSLPTYLADTRVVVLWIVLTVLAAMTGDATRSRAAYLEAMRERAQRAAADARAEADRRITSERLRLARDLHDAVAHHIAVINLQASVAERALPSGADASARALGAVTGAARTVLTDMGNLLFVLREDGTGADDEVLPTAGLADLPTLVEVFRADGLRVSVTTDGAPVAVDEPVEIVAYRTVQEALTNAHKHASDRAAELRIVHGTDVLTISVTNAAEPGAASDPHRRRHGLTGVQERVSSVGGTLRVGPVAPGRFRLTAELPVTVPSSNMGAP
ncbi:sensor histidine kinase [Curtobacterium pusillum]|uniref:sensor histidine kinase n=1 Tax=Curtobacterium pusillum TaxID=69373 RepID=UPI00380372BA